MERRNFLGLMIGGVAAEAAVRAWPFRVYSFPSEIEIACHRIWPAQAGVAGLYGTPFWVSDAGTGQWWRVERRSRGDIRLYRDDERT